MNRSAGEKMNLKANVSMFAILVWLSISTTAAAQCRKDTDCKGRRVCSQGVCVSPPARTNAPPPLQAVPQPVYVDEGDPGWTKAAGIMGVIGAAVAVGLAVGSAATLDNDTETDSILGGASLLTLAVLNPVVAVGAHSGDERGSIGLEITSWVAYGLAIANGIALLVISDADDPATGPLIGLTGTLVGVSLASMSTSAFIASGRSKDSVQAAAPSLRIGPSVAAYRDVDQRVRPTLGIKAQF